LPSVSAIRELPAVASQVIPARWEDQNGHINVGYYMALYNDSGWPMLDLVGVDERYFKERKMGLVDLDNHLRYISELHVGERVTAYGRFLAHDRKRIQGMIFVVNDDKDVLACIIEFLSINFDLQKRRSAEIPADIAARLTAITNEHQRLGWRVDTCKTLAG
jgi:acyl-CoA thioester hydrolase